MAQVTLGAPGSPWWEIDPPKLGSGRCIMSLHICLTPVRGGLSLIRKSFLKKNIDQSRRLCIQDVWKYVILGTDGVAMARHGLILSQNEATGSRKVSRYLPDLRDAIKISKMTAKVQKSKNIILVMYFSVFLYTALFGVSRWGHNVPYFLIKGPSFLSAVAGLYATPRPASDASGWALLATSFLFRSPQTALAEPSVLHKSHHLLIGVRGHFRGEICNNRN